MKCPTLYTLKIKIIIYIRHILHTYVNSPFETIDKNVNIYDIPFTLLWVRRRLKNFPKKVWWVYRMLLFHARPHSFALLRRSLIIQSKSITHPEACNRASHPSAAVTQKTLVALILNFIRKPDTEWRYQSRTFSIDLFLSFLTLRLM